MRPAPLVELLRNEVVESVHLGHLAVTDAAGHLLVGDGDPAVQIYVRSAVKPVQAAAAAEVAEAAGLAVDRRALAIAAASHAGAAGQQVEAARLLALAGLDERALACPPAWPSGLDDVLEQRMASPLAHNCSGKHALFLLAHAASGSDPRRYLRRDARVQRVVRDRLAEAAGSAPQGPGVDGCGAPAWRLPLAGLAGMFGRLAAGAQARLAQVRDAMLAHPELVGGPQAADTQLMLADPRVVAKRGAEGVLAAGMLTASGAVGVAVKISDGGARAAPPVVAAALAALGATVPLSCARPVVLGGSRVQGALRVTPALEARTAWLGRIASA